MSAPPGDTISPITTPASKRGSTETFVRRDLRIVKRPIALFSHKLSARMPAANREVIPDNIPLAGEKPSEHLIREQLSRVSQSGIFSLSTRLIRFLRFVVETTLAGQADTLKEYVIGTEVYDRRPPYHPSTDSIVRTEARRLKSKLKEYYDTEGAQDLVCIYFRSGSYIPLFSSRSTPTSMAQCASGNENNTAGRDIFITVMPFETLSGGSFAEECARSTTAHLAHLLTVGGGCQVSQPSSFHAAAPLTLSGSRVSPEQFECLLFEGTVSQESDGLRVSSRLSSQEKGVQLWSQYFDLKATNKGAIHLGQQVASAIVSRVRIHDLGSSMSGVATQSSSRPASTSLLTVESLMDAPAGFQELVAKFDSLLRLQPDDCRSQCGLAQCLVEEALSGSKNPNANIARARLTVARDIESSFQSPAVQAIRGFLSALEGDVATAEVHFRNAFARSADVTAMRQYGLLQAALGQFEDGWYYLEKAQSIDPFSHRQKLARCKFLSLSRRYEKLVAEHSGTPLYGGYPLESQALAALACVELGQLDRARQLANHVRREAIARPSLMASAIEIFIKCGDTSLAAQLIGSWALFSAQSPISWFRQAVLLIALGNKDAALNALKRARQEKEPEVLWLAVDPRFDWLNDTHSSRDIKTRREPGPTLANGGALHPFVARR